jgi:large subunit ribosomal protein L19
MHAKIDKLNKEQLKDNLTEFGVGDTVKVHTKIVEGGKERIQIFRGIVIARSRSDVNETFTVRRVANNVGIERVFPLQSPRVAKIEVETYGDVRRAKLYYLRDRIGKAARVKTTIVPKSAKKK